MSLNYTGVITRPDITGLPTLEDSGVYHSLKVASNFEDTKIAVSDDYNGKVTVYNYTSNNNTWNFEQELYSGSTVLSNGFGVSLTMDWDADRIAVGANVISKVYTFDYLNGAWSTTPRIIHGNPNSGFGYSISIAANDNRLLCIGAPLESKVYVYNDVQSNWNQVFINDGTDILSRIPLSPTSNIIMKSEYNAYGYHVYMSPSGTRIIAGAPGTPTSNIYTQDIYRIETGGVLSLPATGLDYPYDPRDGPPNGVIPGLMKHVGNARVLLRNGNTWGQQSSGQLGNDIEGDPDKFVLTNPNNVPGYAVGGGDNNATPGWCMPSFGSCTHIKDDELVITVSSPTHSPGGDRAFFSGKISRFIFDEDTFKWVPYGLDILSRFKSAMYGDSFAMDYTGERIAIGTQTQGLAEIKNQILLTGRVHVLEWNKTSWYELDEIILLEDNGINNIRIFDKVNVAITNGKNVFCTSVRRGKLYTKDFNLTQVFIGNNLFTGYVASDVYRVGANNGDNNNITEKKIVFGGTRGDQSYEYTSIENRSLEGPEHSELLLFKRSGETKNTDIIRIKGNEIHLDNYLNGDLMTRILDDETKKFSSTFDTKTIHRPSLVMNWRGSVCIAPHIRQDLNMIRTWYGNSQNVGAPGYNYSAASCDSKAVLDVKGDVYIRNRLNVNDMNKNKIIGTFIAEPHIFYNTRDIDVLYRDPNNSSRILVKSETRPFQFIINDLPGVVEGTVNYLTEDRGFEFIGNGKITNILANGSLNQEVMRTSFWIHLQNDQSTYPTSNIFSFKNPNTRATTVTCQVTSSGVTIVYENSVNGPFSFTTPYTFQKNVWYNIQVQLPGGSQNTPQAIADSDPIDNETFRRSYVGVWINTIPQSLTLNGTAVTSDLSGIYIDLTLGGNTANIIVGMFMHWTGYAFEDLTEGNIVDRKLNAVQNAYRYGHPSEMLVVGGDATVSGKLAIGTVNPTEALEVIGNTTVNGNLYAEDNFAISTTHLFKFNINKFDSSSDTGNLNDTIAFIGRVEEPLFGRYGLFMGVNRNTGHGWISTGRAGTTTAGGVSNGAQFNLCFQVKGGNVGIGRDDAVYKLDVNGEVRATNVAVSSDLRIKKNILDVDDSAALDILRLLKPKTYQYKDTTNRHEYTVYGFIAQDVREVLPYAVKLVTDTIPNIFKNVSVSNVNTLTMDTDGLSVGTIIRLYENYNPENSDYKRYDATVIEIVDETTVIVDTKEPIEADEVFVYGERVDDFHSLNKEVIWTVATAALQDVDRQLQAEKVKVATLEAQMATVLSRLDALTS